MTGFLVVGTFLGVYGLAVTALRWLDRRQQLKAQAKLREALIQAHVDNIDQEWAKINGIK